MIGITRLDHVTHEADRLERESGTWPSDVRDFANETVSALRKVASRSKAHVARSLPRTAIWMILILGWLALTAVVLPLGFLLTDRGLSAQRFILVSFAVGVVGLLIYLFATVRDIWAAAQLHLPERERLT